MYSNQLLNDNDKVNMDFRGAKLEEVLDFVLKGRNLVYQCAATGSCWTASQRLRWQSR